MQITDNKKQVDGAAQASFVSERPGDSSNFLSSVSLFDTDTAWHSVDSRNEIEHKLRTSFQDGLTTSEAQNRLETCGPNRLTPAKKATFLQRLWAQLNNILIFVLVVAAIVTAVLGEYAETGLILGVIFINVAIGLVQEGKAEKAAEAIKAMLSPSADVRRNGEQVSVPAEGLVPGDIVLIKSGDKVPADLRLVEVVNLQVQEAMLTGESVPVSKNLIPVAAASALGDRKCMAYSATTVMTGKGVGVVVATGDNAEIGKINKMVNQVENIKTNLLVQLEILGRWLCVLVAIIALAAFLLAKLRAGESWGDAFKSAVAIAVAIIPEGLPAVVTITLAIGTTVMAKQNAIIRQLPCVETLGSLNVICSDKTGTLTKNEMTAVNIRTAAHLYGVTGVGYAPEGKFTDESNHELDDSSMAKLRILLEGALLCNDSALGRGMNNAGREDWVPNGAPTEVALITAAMKAGLEGKALREAKPRVASVPFESEHKFMATVHQDGPTRVMYVKGAPDRLMRLCCGQVVDDDVSMVGPFDEGFWLKAQEELSSKGLRVLAVCRAELGPEESIEGLTPAAILSRPAFLSMMCMVAILDPPRDEAITAVRVAHEAGIVVKMITGDHSLTALAIGKMLGIEGSGTVLTGPQVDTMSDEELAAVVLGCNIYARASPENKLRIVRALQSQRQVVAMTGDGVNDAPALKAANIGVAMGITGTEVSKEAAKMVLADDNFATIVAAVREGRRVWANLRKILVFNLPVNFAQGTSILWAYVFGPLGGFHDAPLTAIQILYVNLVTSVTIGMMLALEPAEDSVMREPPRRPGKRLMGKLVIWRTLFVSTLLVALVLGMFYWGGVEGRSLESRRAEAFNVLVFCEIGYSITTRFLKACTFHTRTLFGNKWCYLAVAVTAGLQMFLTYTPGVNTFFSMTGLDGIQWARVLCCMVGVYAIVEIEKVLVDPVLMPMVRPILNAIGRHTPDYLDDHQAENEKQQ